MVHWIRAEPTFATVSSTNVQVLAAGTTHLFKAPSDANGGGITIVEAFAAYRAGSAALTLVDLGAAGTAIGGTICAIGTAFLLGVPNVGTPAGYWVDGGNYVGLLNGVGTVTTPGGVSIGYVMGR